MDKIDQAIIESIISVVNPDTTECDQLVMEYLEGYFGDELNESMSDDDIMEAFAKLLETADAVEAFMIQEGAKRDRRVANAVAKQLQRAQGNQRLTTQVVDKHAPTMAKIGPRAAKAAVRRQAFQDRETLAGRKHGPASSRADTQRHVSSQVSKLAGANAAGGRRGGVPHQVNPQGHVVAPGEEPSRRSQTRAKRRDALKADRTRTAASTAASTAAKNRDILNKAAKGVSAIPQKRRPKPKPVISPKAAAPKVKQGLGARLMSRLKGG